MNRSIVAIAIGISAQLAVADPANKPAGKAAYAEGKKKYAEGDYLGAATHFQTAFNHDRDPAYIFNVGQAYRRRAEAKAGTLEQDCFKSWKAYKEFLKLIAEPPNRKEVDGHIIEMERCAGKLALPIEPIDKPMDPIDKPIDPPPIDKPVTSSRDPKQYVGIGVGVVGLIACGFGIHFLRVGADKDQKHEDLLNATPPGTVAELKEVDDAGKAANLGAYISFGVGGAMVIGGTVLFLLGRNATTEQKITVAPSRDGAMVLGSFRF